MFSKLEFSPARAGISTLDGRTFGRVGGDAGLAPPSPKSAPEDPRPESDADDWTPREPVAPPSDIALGVVALVPVWAGIAWIIYTLVS